MSILLGAIADDFTGATDLASFLTESGMRTIQLIGVPDRQIDLIGVDAIVVALKTRNASREDAIKYTIDATKYLQSCQCKQLFFKYCSTFDSTEEGNIGPVADALLDYLGIQYTILCPALPINNRTVYNGHLFVNGRLLNESGMEHHPLTPMNDPDLVRFFRKQTNKNVELIDLRIVSEGSQAIKAYLSERAEYTQYFIVDAISEEHLASIGSACSELKLLTGGSGLAPAITDNFVSQHLLKKTVPNVKLESVGGDCIVLSGSCSETTRSQVNYYKNIYPSYKIDPESIQNKKTSINEVIKWFEEVKSNGPVLVYATDSPETIKQYQANVGADQAGVLVEQFLSEFAHEVFKRGVKKFVVAGGETSGAIVKSLKVDAIRIGPAVDPGVPITQSIAEKSILLVLKSGNFGSEDFFDKAVRMMK